MCIESAPTVVVHPYVLQNSFVRLCNCSVCIWYTVWPEILAGRYFGGLLKIRHLAEFTLAVESVLAI